MLICFHNVASTVNQEMARKKGCLFIHYKTIINLFKNKAKYLNKKIMSIASVMNSDELKHPGTS